MNPSSDTPKDKDSSNKANAGPIIAFLLLSLIILGASITLTLLAKTQTLTLTGVALGALLLATMGFGRYCFNLIQCQPQLAAKEQALQQLTLQTQDHPRQQAQIKHLEQQNATLLQQLQQAKKPEPPANPPPQTNNSFNQQVFIASTMHELRTPLTNMLTLLDLLKDTALDETQADYVNTTAESARHLFTLSNNLLEMAKNNAQHQQPSSPNYGPVNIKELLQTTLAAPKKSAEQKGLVLQTLLGDDLPTIISSDATRLRQVLTNLLNNAIKFTAHGKITVRVSRETLQNQIVLRFVVQDTGIGISAAAQKNLFKPFAQADQSIAQHYGGSGLGLSIAKQIVEALGGNLGVKSEPEKGAIFWFTLPLGAAETSPQSPADELLDTTETAVTEYTGKILVVDSDKLNLGMTQKLLAEVGVVVDGTQSAQEAINRYAEYDLLLISQNLAEQDGLEVTRQIRRHEKNSNTRITLIIITSSNSSQDQQRCGAAGADGILKRPLKRSSLAQMLNRWQPKPATPATNTPDGPKTPKKTGSGYFEGEVLLVDDNPHNQKVAKSVLKMLGVFPDEAVNGLEAVNAVLKRPYDAVLMDCQMPVMDGYEATRQIRAHDQKTGRHTPVIAITANALPSDQERCKECGMDDFLAKPINRDNLAATLINWLSEKPLIPNQQYAHLTSLDPTSLNQLQDALGEEFTPLLTAFLDSAPTLLAGARLAIRDHDAREVRSSVTSLAGSCHDLGAKRLAEMLLDLEKLVVADDFSKASALWDSINIELQQVHRSLKKKLT